MAEKTSRQKVEDLYKLGKGKSAGEIAEALGMSQANVYAHIRKINAENGIASRGRGRPPKVQTEGKESKTEAKSEAKPQASRPAPGKAASKPGPKPATASTNGHDSGEYPHLIEALDKDLANARRTVAKLEKMREALVA